MPETWKPKSFEPVGWTPSSFEPADTKTETKPAVNKWLKGGGLDSSIPLSERIGNLLTGPKEIGGHKVIGMADNPILPENVPRIGDVTGKHEPDTYIGGFINSLYKDFVRPMTSPDALVGGLSIKNRLSNPETYKGMMSAVDRGLPIDPSPVPISGVKLGPKNAAPGLPALGETTNNPRTFYQGPAGTTEAGKQYPIDIAPQKPRLGQTDAGTILPRETEGLSNLDPITAANRGTKLGDIQSIDGNSPAGILRSLEKVKGGEPIKMPVKPNEIGDITSGQGNIEKPNLPYQLESAPVQRKFKPQTFVPDTPETSVNIPSNKGNKVDTANLSKQNNTNGVPTPGQAVSSAPETTPNSPRSKDINNFRAEYGSVDRTLASRPESAPIAEHIIKAADAKATWIATTERLLAEHTKGLNKGELVNLGEIIDKGVRAGDDPKLIDKALAIREVMDSVHELAKIPTALTGGKLGYIENYLSHIDKMPDDDLKTGIRQIWEYHAGKPWQDLFGGNELAGKGNSVGDLYERGLGNPDSPFRKTRGAAEKEIELNPNKVLPAYIESMGRLIFDRPAVDQAKQALSAMPDKDIYGSPSKLKELAGWYIKNYTRYDSMPGLTQGWNDLTNKVLRTTARSMLGFSTGLQTLHLARIPMNLYPELGEKYMLAGVKAVGSKPLQAYKEATALGLLQNEVRPWNFKTTMQKYDSASSFMAGADFLDRAIGYHGFKQMFLDQGMNEVEASAKAVSKAKSSSLFIDAARPTKGFTNDAAVFGGAAGRLTTQFKQVPARIIEQYIQIAANAKNDPAKAARMIGGAGLAIAGVEAGLHTFHISPQQFLFQMAGAAGQQATSIGREFLPLMKGVTQSLANGDVVAALKATQDWAVSDHPKKAAIKTGLWLTPGGNSAVRQYNKGLSMFEDN